MNWEWWRLCGTTLCWGMSRDFQLVLCCGIFCLHKFALKFLLVPLPLRFASPNPFFFLGPITLGMHLISLYCEWHLKQTLDGLPVVHCFLLPLLITSFKWILWTFLGASCLLMFASKTGMNCSCWRDYGVMVELYPSMHPVLIHNSQLDLRKVRVHLPSVMRHCSALSTRMKSSSICIRNIS